MIPCRCEECGGKVEASHVCQMRDGSCYTFYCEQAGVDHAAVRGWPHHVTKRDE